MIAVPSPRVATTHIDPKMADIFDHLLMAPLPVWVDVVRRADLTRHYDLLEWIIGQPECDVNIAQLVFYRANPARHLRNRTTMDPAAPHRDALCLTIVDLAQEGRYNRAAVGLKWSELDQPRNDLTRALHDVPPSDRVFDVPDVLMTAHDLGETALEDLWTPEHDSDIYDLYAAADLKIDEDPAPQVPRGPKPASVLGDFVSLLRPKSS